MKSVFARQYFDDVILFKLALTHGAKVNVFLLGVFFVAFCGQLVHGLLRLALPLLLLHVTHAVTQVHKFLMSHVVNVNVVKFSRLQSLLNIVFLLRQGEG